jgi:hypothetical protein
MSGTSITSKEQFHVHGYGIDKCKGWVTIKHATTGPCLVSDPIGNRSFSSTILGGRFRVRIIGIQKKRSVTFESEDNYFLSAEADGKLRANRLDADGLELSSPINC